MRLGTQIPTFGDPRHPGGNSVPQKFQNKKGEKAKFPPAQERLSSEEKMREKRGKLGFKWCSVRFWLLEREEGGKLGISQGFGNFPGIWDFPRDLGISGMRQIPKERGGISGGVSVCVSGHIHILNFPKKKKKNFIAVSLFFFFSQNHKKIREKKKKNNKRQKKKTKKI